MADKKIIDLGKRLQAAFGYISSNSSDGLQRAGFADAVSSAEVFVRDSRSSFEELVLRHTGNGLELKFGYMSFIRDDGSVFAPPPMIGFRKAKRIEATVLDNTDSEVIENYGHTPWDITIQGILVDMNNHTYPGEKVRQLVRMFNVDDQWDVESSIFQDHNILSIYFTDVESSGVQGFEDTWSFTLTAKSISTVEAYFKQPIKKQ